MLVGRADERQVLDRLVAEARLGTAGALVLTGEPGIGKSALLDDVAARAGDVACLRARGVEAESEVPFGGLLQLLRPALGELERIPEPQRHALATALALEPGEAGDRFAVGAATLSLLAAHAEERPLLLLVDDVQWLDAPSTEALLFAVRRLFADPIAVVLAARDDAPSLLDGSGLPALRLAGLDGEAARALVEEVLEHPLDAVLAERLERATGGNPLALLELAADAPRLAHALPDVPLGVPARVARAFLQRVEALPAETRRLLLLAAACGDDDLAVLSRAAGAQGLSVESFAPAERAGLVQLGEGTLAFRHALVRSAVYGAADAGERRAAHRAVASALQGQDADRRAWHLAAAAIGPDEEASEALEHAADAARARSAYAVSATAYERAGRLADEPPRRARLFHAAADAGWLAGRPERALALLDEALPEAGDAQMAAQIEYLRGYVTLHRGLLMDGHALLVAAAERAAPVDPDLAVLMLAEAATSCLDTGRSRVMRQTAERAVELLPATAGVPSRLFAGISLGMALVLDGEGEAGAGEIRAALALLDEAPAELLDDPRLLAWAALGPLFLRESGAGTDLLDQAVEQAQRRAAVGALPMLLQHAARHLATTEHWAAAEAFYADAIRLARETGQRGTLAASLSGQAWLEAHQGREEVCREHADEAARLCDELGIGFYACWVSAALGELELGLGRPEAAAPHFEDLEARLAALEIDDVDLSPVPELIDVELRTGRPERAAGRLDGLVGRADAKGQPWSLARAARCRGLLAVDGEAADCFDEALALHERTPDAFETGRTLLAYGRRLRRLRQRVRAREVLARALDLFEGLGAAGWADQAAAELAATGATARRRDASMVDALTPQELRIALLLADGRTTREAAATLFLSPKTIEYHLRHIYRKLGISSRDELRAATSSGDAAAGPT